MKAKIILIEDDPSVNEALCLVLERSGFDVTTCIDNEELEWIKADLPDLYIIDRHLAGTDGLDICRRLKSVPATSHIPVIMISASPGMWQAARAVGADEFLEKPFPRSRLLNSLDHLLRRAS